MVRPHLIPGRSLADFGLNVTVFGVALDSRQVQAGDLFVAVAGLHDHGIRFAEIAERNGAVAILTDRYGAAQNHSGLPVIVDENVRATMGKLAAQTYGNPAECAITMGVTGTNGKTSTVFLIAAALSQLNHQVGTIGTLGFRLNGREIAADRTTITTPEAPDLQAILAVMIESQATALALEVSSHALATQRVSGITFDSVGFTMFGRDHLDYHRTIGEYFAAKTKLFTPQTAAQAIVSIDSTGGVEIADLAKQKGLDTVTTSVLGSADYRLLAREIHRDGTSRAYFATPSGDIEVNLGLIGDFNIANALTALAMCEPFGDLESLAAGLASAEIPGRMQRVNLGAEAPNIIVDFAHTPEAVAAALAGSVTGRRIVVLGCGGDRDSAKREPMGVTAAEHADVVIVTDDNPRSEDPQDIRNQVLAGARQICGTEVIDGGDRTSAIALALDLADPQDWVMILGKGHESGQEVAGVIRPFNDVAEVRKAWGRKVSNV